MKTKITGVAEFTDYIAMGNYVLAHEPDVKLNTSIYLLAKLFLEEGAIENIRGDIAFVQSIIESGWFRFNGDADWTQNNYSGIGTTYTGIAGNLFDTPRKGVRAQIQHLKCYANTEPLNAQSLHVNGGEPIDPRFKRLESWGKRGSAPNWEDLGGKWAVEGYTVKDEEHPNGYDSFDEAYADNATYGQDIITKYYDMISSKIAPTEAEQKYLVSEFDTIGVRGGHARGENQLPQTSLDYYNVPYYSEGDAMDDLSRNLANAFGWANLEPEPEKLDWKVIAQRAVDAECETVFFNHTNYSEKSNGVSNNNKVLIIYSLQNEEYKCVYERIAIMLCKHMDIDSYELRTRESAIHAGRDYYSAISTAIEYGIKHPIIIEHSYHVDWAGQENDRTEQVIEMYKELFNKETQTTNDKEYVSAYGVDKYTYIRTNPAWFGGIVAKFELGETAELLQRGKSWYKIEYTTDDKVYVGYVNSKYLIVEYAEPIESDETPPSTDPNTNALNIKQRLTALSNSLDDIISDI